MICILAMSNANCPPEFIYLQKVLSTMLACVYALQLLGRNALYEYSPPSLPPCQFPFVSQRWSWANSVGACLPQLRDVYNQQCDD